MNIEETIKKTTRKLLIDNDTFDYPVKIIRIATSLDINVFEADLEDELSGYIKQKKRGTEIIQGAEIIVNRNHSSNRKRFTIAHEIGHYLLHMKHDNNFNEATDEKYNIQETILNRDNSENKIEREANLFAAELLMNEELIQKAIERNGKKIHLLSKIFEVSEIAMKYRLLNLNIV